jgi:hypothetical protein
MTVFATNCDWFPFRRTAIPAACRALIPAKQRSALLAWTGRIGCGVANIARAATQRDMQLLARRTPRGRAADVSTAITADVRG